MSKLLIKADIRDVRGKEDILEAEKTIHETMHQRGSVSLIS